MREKINNYINSRSGIIIFVFVLVVPSLIAYQLIMWTKLPTLEKELEQCRYWQADDNETIKNIQIRYGISDEEVVELRHYNQKPVAF